MTLRDARPQRQAVAVNDDMSLLVKPPRERPTAWLPLSAMQAACWGTLTIDVSIICTAPSRATVKACMIPSQMPALEAAGFHASTSGS
jgi:hypothetical protein